jgi:hypothetical protein
MNMPRFIWGTPSTEGVGYFVVPDILRRAFKWDFSVTFDANLRVSLVSNAAELR